MSHFSNSTPYIGIQQAIFHISSSIGISLRWEKELVKKDYHLQTYKRWMSSKKVCTLKCRELYNNRINYLKGW